MSDFKVGDTVHYLKCNPNHNDYQYLILGEISIQSEPIEEVWDDGDVMYLEDGSLISIKALYKSKQDCIDAFKNRLDEL